MENIEEITAEQILVDYQNEQPEFQDDVEEIDEKEEE